jgi:hypothetical protein
MEVSPGVVIASAPCAAPYSTAVSRSPSSSSPYSNPEAKLSPPPTRSKISSERLGVASANPSAADHATAPQSLIVALRRDELGRGDRVLGQQFYRPLEVEPFVDTGADQFEFAPEHAEQVDRYRLAVDCHDYQPPAHAKGMGCRIEPGDAA